ncbi:MAG: molybdopterin-dependent oxidoreductase [Parvibaculum sp.]|uniref:nitrate reductase n=1 Tax=Parvibaculum sp. TaxID=2024848 RepID=UPI0025D4BA7D|nr:nitrate reductase [Parvibaculum sp.]MCE9650484.1 molybdopterin-dependent oxidoreductase [Parvibaculum sp.]
MGIEAEPVKTTCPYCGVGCGVIASMDAVGNVSVRGDPDHPANFGRLCSKGSSLGETVGLEGRLLHPEIDGRRASWDEALNLVAGTFRQTIAEHGPDAVAFYVSGQMLTEDYYVANKLMKGFIGSANIDTNSRLCMASSVAGHRRAFGGDVVPGNYEDLELADLIVLVGSNLAWCHPVLFQRIAAAKATRPEMKVVLIDPRRTMSAELADLHLAVKADGDVALFNALLAWLADHGQLDSSYVERHTTGLAEAVAAARALPPSRLAEIAGLSPQEIERFCRLFADTPRVVTIYSQGVNQSESGTDKVNAIINCHLATGRIGKPGCGPFSVTGQPNAMGGREVGGLSNMLAAHMEIESAKDRDTVRRFWNAPRIAEKAGLKAVDLFRAVGEGRIKALWIMATNPVASMPDADAVKAALAACPFVVVSDISAETDTMALAKVKLPATGWGEKDGTVTNSERRISRQRSFLPLVGDMRPDWWIVSEVARRMGFADAFPYEAPAEIFAEYAALTGFENHGRRALDIGAYAGLDEAGYETLPPFQWPRPAQGSPDPARFFGAGGFFTPDGKGCFVPTPVSKPATVGEGAFVLNTGRIRDQWHTMTRTGKSPRLSAHMAEPFAEVNPADAASLGIADADIVEVANGRGKILVRALLSERQQRGAIFVPMHWTDEFAAAARVDVLVAPVTDPVSGQPALKASRADLRRFAAARYGFAVSRTKPAAIGADYWARAACDGGWRIEFAFAEAPADPVAAARTLVGAHETTEMLAYQDNERGDCRLAFFDGGKLVGAFFLSGAPVAVSRSWAVAQLQSPHDSPRDRFRVAAGRGGADKPDAGATVCACFSVGVNQIVAAVAKDGCRDVDAIGRLLKAGTNCGSCRSEIKGLVDAHYVVAAE